MDENWVKPSENKPKWVKMADLVKSHYNISALLFPVLVHCTQHTSVNYKVFPIPCTPLQHLRGSDNPPSKGNLISAHSVHSTIYTSQYIVSNIYCMYNISSKPYSVRYTRSTVPCTLYTVHCTLYTVHCTLYTVHCTL